MDWTIYSTGDGAFLSQILNAVAMITNSGDVATLGAIGFLIGVVFAVVQAIIGGGQKLGFGGMVVAMVMYVGMFSPQVRVTVFDTYTSAGRQVDNVPLGVAAVGSILSHVGYGITKFMEEAYSIPGMLDSNGYGTPLEMLLSVRRSGLGTANSLGPHDNFLQTLANYSKDCTEVGINLGFLDPAKIIAADNVWPAVQFASQLYTTKIYLPGSPAGGQKVTCSQAYTAISNQWGQRLDAWNLYISHRYNITDARTVIQGALNNLVKVGLSADQYMKSALVMQVLRRVDRGDYSPGMYTAALLNTQATEQARAQFAGDASMFAQFARPLMTFVEGFVYSLTPFMAFVIGFGLMGIKLVGRYLLMLMWVQLWMPILSVINLFIEMSYLHKMDALNSLLQYNGDPLSALSMLGMQAMQNQAASWIAVGGDLVAAAPALALGIIYGGAYSLVNIAHRLSPGDMVDEKQAAPDLMKNPGVLTMTPQMQYDPTRGMRLTGADDVLGNATIGTSLGQAVSSTGSQLASSQHAYSSSVNQGISNLMKGGVSASKLQQLGHNVSGAKGTTFGHSMETAENLAKKYGFDAKQTSALKGLVTASASGAVGAPSGKAGIAKFLSAKLGLEGRADFSNDASKSQSFGEDFSNLFKEASSEQVQRSFNDVTSATAQDAHNQSWETVASEQNSQDYKDSLQRVRQDSKAYSEAQSLSHSVGANQSIPLTALAKSMAGNDETMGYIHENLAKDADLDKRVDQRMSAMEGKGLFGDPRVKANEDRYRAAAYFQETAAHAFDAGLDPVVQGARETGLRMALENSGYAASDAMPQSTDPRAYQGESGTAKEAVDNAIPSMKARTHEARTSIGDAERAADQAPGHIQAIDAHTPAPEAYKDKLDKEKAQARQDVAMTGLVGDKALVPQLRHLEQSDRVPTAAQLYGATSGIANMIGLTDRADETGKPDDPQAFKGNMIEWYQRQKQQLDLRIAQQVKEQTGDGTQLAALQKQIEHGVVDMHNGLHDCARAAGMTDLQADIFSYAATRSFGADLQSIPGLNTATKNLDTIASGLGVNMNLNVESGAREKYYDQLHDHYMKQFDGNQALADETTSAVFNRLINAGKGGSAGIEYLQPVAGLNMAIQSGNRGQR